MTSELDDQVDRVYRVTAIMSVALVVSAVFYAGIVEVLSRTTNDGPAADAETIGRLRLALQGLALVQFLVIAWLGSRERLVSGEPRARLARLRTVTVVRLTLAEAIAIYGLLLFFLSRDTSDFHYLFLVSLLAFLVAFPRRDRWKEAMRQTIAGPGGPVSTG